MKIKIKPAESYFAYLGLLWLELVFIKFIDTNTDALLFLIVFSSLSSAILLLVDFREFRLDQKKRWFVLIFLIVSMILPILMLLVLFFNSFSNGIFLFENTSLKVLDQLNAYSEDKKIEISTIVDYFGYITNALIVLTASVTGAWLASRLGYNAQKKLFDKQENNEISKNALIVYYDLKLGLQDIKKLYLSCQTNNWAHAPKEMYLSNDWISNVAVISKSLNLFGNDYLEKRRNKDFVKEIYLLYGDLITVKNELSEYKNKDMTSLSTSNKDAITSIVIKLFNKNYIDRINGLSKKFRDIEKLLNDKKRKLREAYGVDVALTNPFIDEKNEELVRDYDEYLSAKKSLGDLSSLIKEEKLCDLDIDKDLKEDWKTTFIAIEQLTKL